MILMAFLEKHFHRLRTCQSKKGVCHEGPSYKPETGHDPRTLTTPEKMDLSEDLPDDYETSLAQKAQREAQLRWWLVLVCGSVAGSWALGAAGLSLAWLLLLLGAVAAVWRASLGRLVDDVVSYETLRVRRRRAVSDDETAEWVNFLINRWWIFSSPTLFTIVKEHLEPILNEAKPSIVENLEVRQFTLGSQTPQVAGVRVFDIGSGRRVPLSMRSLFRPPQRLGAAPRHQVAVEARVSLDSDDFRLMLRTRLFGKGVGMDLDLVMEKLNITGKIFMTFALNKEAPFPHITHLTVTFIEKPDVWFSVRILKAVQMMEVPLLKTWIHSLVMDALVTALVDPGKIDINLTPHDRPSPGDETRDNIAQGVLTVTLSAAQGHESDDIRWLVLTLGDQRIKTSHLNSRWQESPSFLVSSLQTEHLMVKLKSKRLVSSITLAQFELPLSTYNFDSSHVIETTLHKKLARSSSGVIPNISLRLEYTPLPAIQLDQPETLPTEEEPLSVSGVLFVYIHKAEGLVGSDSTECNPYCMVFNNRKKVKTTHYLKGTGNPQWESRTQFLVSDYTQASLSFVICSWSPNKMADTDLLGLANFCMTKDNTSVVHKELALNGASNQANIIFSVVFRSVPSVAQSSHCNEDCNTSVGLEDEEFSLNRTKRNSNTWMQQAKMLLVHRDLAATSDISNLLSNGLGLMEVSLIRARDLESKDLNGFSDPYCELKINGECKYKSTVKKKTLNPNWEESAIMGLPRQGETLEVLLWDHDTFGSNDFLGSITLSLEDIRRLSISDSIQSLTLQGVKTGVVDLRVKVISEDCESQNYQPSINSCTSSPRLPLHHDRESGPKQVHSEHPKLKFPPPAPPRTVTLRYKPTVLEDHSRSSEDSLHTSVTNGFGNNSSNHSGSSSPQLVPHVTVTELHANNPLTVVVSDLHTRATVNGQHSPTTPSPDSQFKKSVPEYSSFRVMKQKVKRGLKLRRFRSEVSVNEEHESSPSGKATAVTLSIEPSGGGESDATELLQMDSLSHAVSQPNILHLKQTSPRMKHKRPQDLKVSAPLRPDKYFGVEGKVIQAQGLHVAHVAQLYLRIKLQSTTSPDKAFRMGSNVGGKTLAKSRLLPAMPNPRFDLNFQIDHPECVPRYAALLFEIRSSGKEIVGSRRVTLQDLLSAASPDTNEVHTWLALNNGASLEVEIAHSRELKKTGRKIFRSWSVHRIGKI